VNSHELFNESRRISSLETFDEVLFSNLTTDFSSDGDGNSGSTYSVQAQDETHAERVSLLTDACLFVTEHFIVPCCATMKSMEKCELRV
jgi:hypothetical protein